MAGRRLWQAKGKRLALAIPGVCSTMADCAQPGPGRLEWSLRLGCALSISTGAGTRPREGRQREESSSIALLSPTEPLGRAGAS